MDSSQLIEIIIELLGGLGLFLFGMNMMADGLEKSAGNKMKKIIEVLTKNRIMAVLIGALVTMVVQSSSATTVMVVGFVNAGIMNLTQAIGIIMGANIGTTFTAQLVSINLTALAPIAIAIGVFLKLFSKNSKTKKYGDIVLGFGILFMGMDVMKHSVKPLREFEGFTTLLQSFGNGGIKDTVLAIFTGFAITAIVQSSSATTSILIALASAGLLPIESAFPVLLGTNIGTCVTAMISSIGASKTAKRAALMHLLFNLLGTTIFIIFFARPTIHFVSEFSTLPERQLANAHTLFNIATTLLLIPFAGLIVKAVERIIPVTEEEKASVVGIKYLDERLLETPYIAVGQVIKEVLHMGNVTQESLKLSAEAFLEKDEDKAKEAFKLEKSINDMEKEIAEYLIKLSNANISDDQRIVIDGLFSTINDIERVGDHADNLAEIAVYRIENKLIFSDNAINELKDMIEMVKDAFHQSIEALSTGNVATSRDVLEIEGTIDSMEMNLRKKHIRRLNEGKCIPDSGVIYLDIISNLERVGDHSSNIALAVLDTAENREAV
ncbi:MAG: Na/Pi cotransporter family protein [Firmicutes bacterium]|jgi:phosphate:Na+ symporter|nr:Na/Pi cotransporter family protein [Bacillota bacterium]